MKRIVKITENDILKIVKSVLNEQQKKPKSGGGGSSKKEITISGHKIKATDKGNIQIIDPKGNVYYYSMEISGFDTTVVNFGDGTITVIDPTPVFGGDEMTKEFNETSPSMKAIKANLGKEKIQTLTNDGKKLILYKVN